MPSGPFGCGAAIHDQHQLPPSSKPTPRHSALSNGGCTAGTGRTLWGSGRCSVHRRAHAPLITRRPSLAA